MQDKPLKKRIIQREQGNVSKVRLSVGNNSAKGGTE